MLVTNSMMCLIIAFLVYYLSTSANLRIFIAICKFCMTILEFPFVSPQKVCNQRKIRFPLVLCSLIRIFAANNTTDQDMNIENHLCNLLISRRLPPPISSYKVNRKTRGQAYSTLLHRAFAHCGRVFLFFIPFLLLPFCLCSCEKESITSDDEAITRTVPADSTAVHDDGLLHIGNIAIDTAWAGQTIINY